MSESPKIKLIRSYEGKNVADAYAKYRPSYPKAVTDRIIGYLRNKMGMDAQTKFESMPDVGCGCGQSTYIFADYFKSIVGIDISEAQIEQARKLNQYENISYQLVHGYVFPFGDNSIDLIASGTAAHFFDIPKFEKECERVLKPNGVCVVFSRAIYSIKPILNDDENAPAPSYPFYNFYKEFFVDINGDEGNIVAIDGNKVLFNKIQNDSKECFKDLIYRDENVNTLVDLKNFMTTMGEYLILMETQKPDIDPLTVMAKKVKKLFNMEGVPDENVKLITESIIYMFVFTKRG
ncbi:uncharacterized protein LOC120332000 [Styela clava]